MSRDIFGDSWVVQEWRREGEIRARHQDVLNVIQARFPEILPYAKQQMEGIKDTELLSRMNVKMSTVQTAEEALEYLFTIDETKKN